VRKENPLYALFDVVGYRLLSIPSHAAHSRTQSYEQAFWRARA
jgi:hypothetical protein